MGKKKTHNSNPQTNLYAEEFERNVEGQALQLNLNLLVRQKAHTVQCLGPSVMILSRGLPLGVIRLARAGGWEDVTSRWAPSGAADRPCPEGAARKQRTF